MTPLVLALSVGCAGMDAEPSEGSGGKADDLGEQAIDASTWAKCFVEPGEGDRFFNPDQLLCEFNPAVFAGQRGAININGEFACGSFNVGFLSDALPEGPVVIHRLILADNTCPNGIPDNGFPVSATIKWSGTPLNPRGKSLAWDFGLAQLADATAEAPVRARSAVQPWTIEIENHLVDTRFVLVRSPETSVSLGEDLVARVTTLNDSSPDESEVVIEQEQEAFRQGEEGHTFVVYADAATGATLEIVDVRSNESTPFELSGPGRYALSDTGLERLPDEAPEDDEPTLPGDDDSGL